MRLLNKNMEENKRTGKKRLSVDLPEKWHKELKFVALKYNMTVSCLIARLVLDKLKIERELDGESLTI